MMIRKGGILTSTKRAVTSEAARTSLVTKEKFCTRSQNRHKTTEPPGGMRLAPGFSSFKWFPVPYGQKR